MQNKYFSKKSFDEYLKEFEAQPQPRGEKLKFDGVDGRDIYNPTAPFWLRDKKYIAGRVDVRKEKLTSEVIFFIESGNGIWRPAPGIPSLKLEDPSVGFINNELIFSGVEVRILGKGSNDEYFDWGNKRTFFHTVFYKALNGDLKKLIRFAEGPAFMKDVRFLELPNKEILFATRPMETVEIIDSEGHQKEFNLRQIGFTIIKNLEELKDKNRLKDANILENYFPQEAWGGVNDMHMLDEERVGILGHVAREDAKENLHYHAMSFIYNIKTKKASDYKIVAVRKNFPVGPAKEKRLKDVIFSGQVIKNPDDTWDLYSGLSDAEVGKITLTNLLINK